LLGSNFIQRAHRWYCSSPLAFTFVVTADRKIVGYASVCKGKHSALFLHNSLWLLLEFIRKPSLFINPFVFRRLKTIVVSALAKGPIEPVRIGGFLAYLAVDSSVRNNGLAKVLIEACVCECRARDWPSLCTGVHYNNNSAVSFYLKLGFRESADPITNNLIKLRLEIPLEKPGQKTGKLVRMSHPATS
jgi:GNAT superfamily N-acetyltransferase